MKHTFNDITFNIEGCQWWTTPESNSHRWIIGCKFIKDDSDCRTATTIRHYESQEAAELALKDHLNMILRKREARESQIVMIFHTLRITVGERKRYRDYINYWLNQELAPEIIVKRFAKDHPKWEQPRAPHERPDSNRNPYREADGQRQQRALEDYRRHVERQLAAPVGVPVTTTAGTFVAYDLSYSPLADAEYQIADANTRLLDSLLGEDE